MDQELIKLCNAGECNVREPIIWLRVDVGSGEPTFNWYRRRKLLLVSNCGLGLLLCILSGI